MNANDPAYPLTENNGLNVLTIRQHFASLAMQGMAQEYLTSQISSSAIAQQAVKLADAEYLL